MASLLSGFRNKCTASSASIRSTGKPKGGDTVEMGAIPPLSSSEFAPGTKSKTTIAASSSSSSGGSIVLDSAALDPGEEIAVRELTIPGKDGEEDKTVKVLATEDFDLSAAAESVTSLNGQTGDMDVIGGEHIEVSTDGQTIKISYSESKEDEDPDPNADGDSCSHDDVGGDGGGAMAGGGGGGVPADGDVHPGSDCNCE